MSVFLVQILLLKTTESNFMRFNQKVGIQLLQCELNVTFFEVTFFEVFS